MDKSSANTALLRYRHSSLEPALLVFTAAGRIIVALFTRTEKAHTACAVTHFALCFFRY
jgi:hypothetical protein